MSCIIPDAVRSVLIVRWLLDGAGAFVEASYGAPVYDSVRWIISDTAFYVVDELATATGPGLYVPANVLTPLPSGLRTWTGGKLVISGAAGATVRANLYRLDGC